MDGNLSELLAAREERALVQRVFLGAAGASFVVQISLNIPGLPKRLKGDEQAVIRAREIFLSEYKVLPSAEARMVNFAGVSSVILFAGGGAASAKRTAVAVEDGAEWGRILDIDVITGAGPVPRTSLGFSGRKCMLCGETAKICARERGHPVATLREEASRLLRLVRSG
ncbi:MAG: citrate lyase holo-[acyl-carrier protein] synthase [Clostridiales Family XIII bacterium]|jgi:holo-ACP synthase CitX|nr:citrate lyase holo-[acyl-carrier protein] synthase [Clostridiales Family XIII bacterium]